MTKEQDLSSFAAFDLNDLLAEISQSSASKKEVTAYLDRTFLMNMINEYHEQTKLNDVDYTVDKKIDITEYNFTGADFRGIPYSDFALFDMIFAFSLFPQISIKSVAELSAIFSSQES